ncbi:esterase FE4-like [Ptiloglossa arizonensis]|uniref:esterase FE4-like n=1 Tax=Ptiloglossa arizonensis TaxID=3350558 RepID=UPI003FA06211
MCELVVTVKQGKLRGGVVQGVLGPSYIAFHDIPFAAPPIGKLRFKDPQPPASWTGIRDSSKCVGSVCPQIQEIPPYNIIGEEDCLYLNVFTNSISDSTLKPVMFWIHGGAFLVGNGSYNAKRPDYLIVKDVVIVTTNYRLGAFGFLNLGHKSAPGNQGLKDLIAALQWVKENIANFGGDPNNVTIFGPSAGGALIHALTVSPPAQGLFHKAVIQSGVLTSPWAYNQSLPERCFKLATLLGKESTDPVEVVEFLRTIDAKDIVKAQSNILSETEVNIFCLPFALNSDSVAEYSVLPQPMDTLISMIADIPIMMGHTSHEYIMFMKDKSEETIQSCNQYLPLKIKILAAMKKLGPAKNEELMQTIKNHYFGGQPITLDNILALVRFTSDYMFGIPSIMVMEDRVKKTSTPCYYYRFSYVGNQETHTDLLVDRVVTGASHVDELSYLFYSTYLKIKDLEPPADGTQDRVIMERLTRMWTNFAKTGNPTPHHDDYIKTTWKPVTKDKFNYLEIGAESELQIMEPHVLNTK